jgi:hypothetical protein
MTVTYDPFSTEVMNDPLSFYAPCTFPMGMEHRATADHPPDQLAIARMTSFPISPRAGAIHDSASARRRGLLHRPRPSTVISERNREVGRNLTGVKFSGHDGISDLDHSRANPGALR